MDARRALLTRLFDHAPLFPPASMTLPDAVAEDRRAQASEHAWLLGRFVVPEGTDVEGRELAVVSGRTETQGDLAFVEGVSKIRCGGAAIPSVDELAAFIRGCREHGVLFKATAGLHHAYPTELGEHGFLNLLAAAVFGDEEEALSARPGSFALGATRLVRSRRRVVPLERADGRRGAPRARARGPGALDRQLLVLRAGGRARVVGDPVRSLAHRPEGGL